jgi:hypothetical protein
LIPNFENLVQIISFIPSVSLILYCQSLNLHFELILNKLSNNFESITKAIFDKVMKGQLNIVMSPPHGFGTLIAFIIIFQYIKSISTESQSFEYVTNSLLPPYSKDQLIEWEPKGLQNYYLI